MAFPVHKDYRYPITTDKDIICYKRVRFIDDNTVESEIERFKYTLGKLYKISSKDFKRSHRTDYSISKGFHSFIRKDIIGLGWKDDVIVECTIPANTVYFINPDKDEQIYVSEAIIINKVL